MKHVIITGASGMVGGILLDLCLQSDEIGMVTSLARKPSRLSHPKLKEVVMEDFAHYDSDGSYLESYDIAFFCIGVYTGAVPRDEFRKITVDYPVAFARELHQKSPDATFCLLSGAGADRTEMSRMMFATDKGSAENQLSAMGFKAFHAFRPAYIYPVDKRYEPNFSYRVMRAVYPLLKLFGKKYSVRSTELAQAMFHVGLHGSELEVLENKDIVDAAIQT